MTFLLWNLWTCPNGIPAYRIACRSVSGRLVKFYAGVRVDSILIISLSKQLCWRLPYLPLFYLKTLPPYLYTVFPFSIMSISANGTLVKNVYFQTLSKIFIIIFGVETFEKFLVIRLPLDRKVDCFCNLLSGSLEMAVNFGLHFRYSLMIQY